MKRALITGVTGQDGSYLAEILLLNGYEVHGIIRRSSSFNTGRIDHIFQRLKLHYGDLTDAGRISELVREIAPNEIYNLGAQSHVRVSFDMPAYTAESVALGTSNLLEAARRLNPMPRFYQASSSEQYGKVLAVPQNEQTPFNPRSPYACAKVHAHFLAVNYREAYGLPVSCGILFNHESPRRGETFVTRKVTRAVGRIFHGLQDSLALGNLDARRDWGHASDYCEAMWRMLQAEPDDFVIATGNEYTVREFVEAAFSVVGLNWAEYVRQDPRLYRPTEVEILKGDASKARRVLGWAPRVTFKELVKEMVEADVRLASREAMLAAI